MINSVSSVSFKAATPQDALSRPGKYSLAPKETVVPEKKNSHKALKWIAGITATALAACGLLILGHKQGKFTKLADNAIKEAKFMDKVNHYLAVAGEKLSTKVWDPAAKFVTEDIPAKCKELWKKIKPGKAEETAEAVAEKAAEVVA